MWLKSSPRLLKNSVHIIAVIMAALTLYTSSQGLEENTYFTISVNPDGSAEWVVEHRYPLKTAEDMEAFKAVAADISKELMVGYRSRLEQLVLEASKLTGRNMGLSGFDVHAYTQTTLTGGVGVIVFKFVWTGFASAADDKIYVGEVFVGGLSLAGGETLTLKIPYGYHAVDYSPKPDEIRDGSLVWYGPRSFTDGRPMAVFSKQSNLGETLTGYQLVLISLTALAFAGASAALYLRKRSEKVPESGFKAIIEVLKRHGGEAPQHVIVEETGLSKASVSIMLKALESSGVVVRVKSGRTKVVRLVR